MTAFESLLLNKDLDSEPAKLDLGKYVQRFHRSSAPMELMRTGNRGFGSLSPGSKGRLTIGGADENVAKEPLEKPTQRAAGPAKSLYVGLDLENFAAGRYRLPNGAKQS